MSELPPPAAPAMAPPQSYESALSELEQLLAVLEGGQLPLEQALHSYHRGAHLLKWCQNHLSQAEQRVKILENELLQDFKPNGG